MTSLTELEERHRHTQIGTKGNLCCELTLTENCSCCVWWVPLSSLIWQLPVDSILEHLLCFVVKSVFWSIPVMVAEEKNPARHST